MSNIEGETILNKDELTKELKEKALQFGAGLVGVVSAESIDEVEGHWVGWQVNDHTRKTGYYLEGAKSVVVLGYHAYDDVHEIALAKAGGIEYPVYQGMRLSARRLLRYIQEKGYKGIVYPSMISQKRLAQLAGLGAFGKNSLIIDPEYGPWIRLHSVLTDAELVPDAPFTDDLCRDCVQCVEACPTGALSPYEIDPERCLIGITEEEMSRLIAEGLPFETYRDTPGFNEVFQEHMPKLTESSVLMCTTCQKVCPYGKHRK